MLKDITLGQYFPGQSYLHKMDPRFKMIATVGLIALIFSARNVYTYLTVTVFLAACVRASDVPLRIILRGVRPILMLILITALFNIFYTPGKAVFTAGFLTVTQEGLITSFFMVLRILYLVIATSLMTYTTSPIQLTDGLERLLSPLKLLRVPVHEFAMMMTIALRFIPTLIDETDKIISAQKARGADFNTGGLYKRAKAYLPVLVPLIISAFRRAEELAVAMECRCYRGGEGRTRLRTVHAGIRDAAAMLLIGAALGLVIAINIIRPGWF